MKYLAVNPIVTGALIALSLLAGSIAAGESPYLSPLALAVQGETVYVAAHTANQILIVDAAQRVVSATIALPGLPTGLALAPGGGMLYVTGGGLEGQVYAVDLATSQVAATYAAGHTPKGPVLTPDGKTLFVCSQFSDAVTVIDLAGAQEPVRIPVSREPVAAALGLGGTRLVVANHLPAGRADAGYVSAAVDVIEVATRARIGSVSLPNGSSSLMDICTSPDGRYAYVTHILSRYQLPTTQLERGWVNTNAVSVIDVASLALVNTVLLDDVDLGAANPWGVICTPDGQWLCVAHSGTHELSIIRRDALHEKLAAAASAGTASRVPNDLAFLVGLRTRIPLKGIGPRGVAVTGARILAAEYFSGTLASVVIADDTPPRAESFALGEAPAMTAARAGEAFFHDASVCFQQWQSCASCHPGGARVDALNWDLLNDGMGNPKNTKSLLLSYDTPPTTVIGARDNAMTSTRSGIRHILFTQPEEAAASSVDAYLSTLKPVPGPVHGDAALAPSIARGRAIFESAGCARCHPAPLFTDMQGHRVGTGKGRETEAAFDTPTLVEIWRTAPYLHDGRARTLVEVITTFNEQGLHGVTAALTAAEVEDLVAYLHSL